MSFITGKDNVKFTVYATQSGVGDTSGRPIQTTVGTVFYKGVASFRDTFSSSLQVGDLPDLTILCEKSVPVNVDDVIQVVDKDGTDYNNFKIVEMVSGKILGGVSQVKKLSCIKQAFHTEYYE
jgi:hypothetical protein